MQAPVKCTRLASQRPRHVSCSLAAAARASKFLRRAGTRTPPSRSICWLARLNTFHRNRDMTIMHPPLQLQSIWHPPTSCRNCMLRRAAQRPTTRGTHCANGRRALRRSRGAILTQAALYTQSRQHMRYGLQRCDCNRWPAPRGTTQPCNAMRAVAMPTKGKCTRCGYIRARPRRPRNAALARFARKLYQATPASQHLKSTRRGTRLKPDLNAHLVSKMIPFFKPEIQGRRSLRRLWPSTHDSA